MKGRDKRIGGRAAARRRAVVAAVLAAPMLAACADGVSPASDAPSTPVATVRPTGSPQAESPDPAGHERDPHPTASPTPADPYALADGVYPAYIRDVDPAQGTITVDVVQTFEGWRAKQAALEDGLAPWKARQYRYAPVYIRDENPLLRTLSVSRGVAVDLWGECEGTETGRAGMRELAARALPYTTDWYYSLTMRADVVDRIVQHIAISAC